MIPYIGCYNGGRPQSWNGGGGATHTPETCNTACLGFSHFATSAGGNCYCGAIADLEAQGVATNCHEAHRFRHGLTSGCALDASFLCGGPAMMAYRVTAPPPSDDSPRAVGVTSTVGETWIVDSHSGQMHTIVGQPALTEQEGSEGRREFRWPVRCASEADLVAVRAACTHPAVGHPNPTACAGNYCKSLLPRASRTDAAATWPATPDDCVGTTCRRYRVQFGYSGGGPEEPSRLVKLCGTLIPQCTKWLVLPSLFNGAAREVDAYIPDFGELTNVTMWLDEPQATCDPEDAGPPSNGPSCRGTFTYQHRFIYACYFDHIRIAAVDDNDP